MLTPMRDAPADSTLPASFESEIARSLAALRDAYAALLDALDTPITSGADLQRATRLDMKLCWKVVRMVNAVEPLAAAPFILGPANSADFFKVMMRKGVTERLIERARKADRRLHALIDEHAGDRRTFETMVSDWSGDAKGLALRQRRAAFAGNCDVWGMSSDVIACCCAIQPSRTNPDGLDILALNAEFGMRRLRRTNLPLYFKRALLKSATIGDDSKGQTRTSLGTGDARSHQIGLIEELSTKPTPELLVRQDPDGASTITLAHDRIGSKASIDLSIGYLESGVPMPVNTAADPGWIVHGTQIRKPCKLAIVDLLLRRGMFEGAQLRCAMAPTHAMFPRTRRAFEAFGNIDETAAPARLIGDREVLARREAGRYGELVDWGFARAQWDLSDFVVHRYAAEYPVPMSTLCVYFDLP